MPTHLTQSEPVRAVEIAERLNRDCFCVGTDVPEVQRSLETLLASSGEHRTLLESHPHLFSAAPVFIAGQQLQAMADVIAAIETVMAMPAWRAATLAAAPAIASAPQATRGVFMGYDFHIQGAGARLIEINTNAGGAMLNLAMARAQHACCSEVLREFSAASDIDSAEQRIVDMFRAEWRLARGDQPLQRVAIVDSAPAAQYLYPEFLLFQRLLSAHGIATVIADPAELVFRDGGLFHQDQPVDLIYNRLTDFYLDDAAHAHLRSAYLGNAAVFTPHPQAHALYANKHNLELLTNPDLLRSWGVAESVIALLMGGIPRTIRVAAADPGQLWQERSRWFFKPASGFGSRGSYRGDKLTRKVFDNILAGDYVAQALVPPSERMADGDDGRCELKLDLRHYAYAGEVQLVAARLYQGQTTNFRTVGGGFAPVYLVPSGNPALVEAMSATGIGACGISATSKCATAAISS